MVDLKPQLFVGSQPDERHFKAPTNQDDLMIKPRGGLWTSTYDPDYGSAWIQWCLGEDFGGPYFRSWLLEPAPDLRVFEIDRLEDLHYLARMYTRQLPPNWPRIGSTLDFEALAKVYDAIHLTERGQHATRLVYPENLYGWDCECTLWLRWAFTNVTDLRRTDWSHAHATSDG